MKRIAILLRDHSRESEEAEKILKENNIEYTRLFSTDGRLSCVISPNHAYSFNGIGGVRLFIRGVKTTK